MQDMQNAALGIILVPLLLSVKVVQVSMFLVNCGCSALMPTLLNIYSTSC